MARRNSGGCISGLLKLMFFPFILLATAIKPFMWMTILIIKTFYGIAAFIIALFGKFLSLFHYASMMLMQKNISSKTLDSITDGYQFEEYIAYLMRRNGFRHVKTTTKSRDYGVDIIATKDRTRYAVQCKLYSNPVGSKAVQEIFAGARYHKCNVAVVATNNTFTQPACNLASTTNVVLWDRRRLVAMERAASRSAKSERNKPQEKRISKEKSRKEIESKTFPKMHLVEDQPYFKDITITEELPVIEEMSIVEEMPIVEEATIIENAIICAKISADKQETAIKNAPATERIPVPEKISSVKEVQATKILVTQKVDRYNDVLTLIKREEPISISALQKKLDIGYRQTNNIVKTLCWEGLVTPLDDSGDIRYKYNRQF